MSIAVMNYVWTHSKQKGTARLLMVAIADNANENGDAFPGIEKLAEKCAMSERHVQRTINKLELDGELKVFENGGTRTSSGWTNLYRIVMPGVKAAAPLGCEGQPIQAREVTPVSPRKFSKEVTPVSSDEVTPVTPHEVTSVSPKPSGEPSEEPKEKDISPPKVVRVLTPVGSGEEVVVEDGHKSQSFTALERQIMSANNAKTMKTNLSRKLDTPITVYQEGKPVAYPSANTLFTADELFPSFITVLIANEIERFKRSSSKPPSRDYLVSRIMDYGGPDGWIAFKARYQTKPKPVAVSAAAASSPFLDSIMGGK